MTSIQIFRGIDIASDVIEFTYDVTASFFHHFIGLCVIIYVAGEFTGKAFYSWHKRWTSHHDLFTNARPEPFTEPAPEPMDEPSTEPLSSPTNRSPLPAFINPITECYDDLMTLTARDLREILGRNARCSKHKMILEILTVAV